MRRVSTAWRPYIVDVVIVLIFALAPGIRGYDNWRIYEYLFLLLLLVGILYTRHASAIRSRFGGKKPKA
jgi:hypothetical protein